jgi:hypothetical protein
MPELTVTPIVQSVGEASSQDSSNLGLAAVGGGGIGTLIVGFAQLIPDANTWKTVLVIIAPAVSVGISTLWALAVSEYTRRRQDKVAQDTIEKLRKYLRGYIDNPNTPEDLKINYKKKLQVLDDVVFSRDIEKIKNLI